MKRKHIDMEGGKNMIFNTQVCTTIDQSERLLALGLKKETADMYLTRRFVGNNGTPMIFVGAEHKPSTVLFSQEDIPAWSLHRLVSLMPNAIGYIDEGGEEWGAHLYVDKHVAQYDAFPIDVIRFDRQEKLYDNIIDCIRTAHKRKSF